MSIEAQVREALEGLLRVIAGASQIAIDRGASSGVIDFKESIDKVQFQIHALYLEEFEKMLFCVKDKNWIYPDPGWYNGFCACLDEIRGKLKELRKG